MRAFADNIETTGVLFSHPLLANDAVPIRSPQSPLPFGLALM
jgi:hypothetical protein